MFRPTLWLSLLLALTVHIHAQCTPSITPIRDRGRLRPPTGLHIPAGTHIQASYSLTADDRLMMYAGSSSIGAHTLGLIILRTGREPQYINLRTIAEHSGIDREDSDNFYPLVIAKGCTTSNPVYFAAFHYDGDVTSPELVLIFTHGVQAYDFSTLPLLDGGTLEISKADASVLET